MAGSDKFAAKLNHIKRNQNGNSGCVFAYISKGNTDLFILEMINIYFENSCAIFDWIIYKVHIWYDFT